MIELDPAPVLRLALAGGGELAELFVEDTLAMLVAIEAGRVEHVASGQERGAGLRVLRGRETLFGYTTDLSPAGLAALARLVAGGGAGGEPALAGAAPPRHLPPLEARVALAWQAERRARGADARVAQVSVVYREADRRTRVASSDGTDVHDRRVGAQLSATAVARGDGELQTGFEAHGGTLLPALDDEGCDALALIGADGAARVGATAARRALLSLEARPAPAGVMPVVLGASAGGTFVHEALGHGLEADIVEDGMSIYEGCLGERVASALVTVVDDPTLAGCRGSYRFDDEGTPAGRTVLVEGGVLRSYLCDRLRARRLGLRSTGNGRRESYRSRPIVRMSNVMILPGADDPAAILRDTPRGLYVAQMGGGQVETVSGAFVFEVTEGYLIEGGALGVAVRGATLTGNGPEALASIDRVGTDLGFAVGTCGKDAQDVPVADAQPTLRLPELVVGGRS